ncbi:MAG: hypothetical protein GY950_17600 [bacterium]|nr:hypothetical protein [bacterium]
MIELKSDILYEAIDLQVGIELRKKQEQADEADENTEEVLFLSHFVQVNHDEQQIIIDFPTASQELEALKRDDAVLVKFNYKESPYIFYSTVIGLTHYEPEPGNQQQGMIIQLAESIFGDERRAFLKVKTPPFQVTFTVSQSTDFARRASRRIYKAQVLNISGGGIGIQDEEGKFQLSEGDTLDMTIGLPDQKLRMEGELLNIYRYENTERTGFGLRFLQKAIDRPTFNKNQRLITRYVMRRERELLSR